MTPQDVTTGLMRDVVNSNIAAYKEIFYHTGLDEVTDPYWHRALAFFSSLSEEQQTALFEVVRQVSVDTVSNVLGILDGVSMIEGAHEGFTVMYGRDQKINGDLQNLFLAENEQTNKRTTKPNGGNTKCSVT